MSPIMCNKAHFRWNNCDMKKKKPKKYRESIQNDAVFAVMIERNRISFELHDYARGLAAAHMIKYGIRDESDPLIYPPSSYVEMLSQLIPQSDQAERELDRIMSTRKTQYRKDHHKQCQVIYENWETNQNRRPWLFGGLQ